MRFGWDEYEDSKVEFFAPKLTYFSFTSTRPLCFSKIDVPALEEMYIDVRTVAQHQWNPVMETERKGNQHIIPHASRRTSTGL
ncbi:hypothetical protein CFOL_v3_34900, partial [Cephalotus follicularis]